MKYNSVEKAIFELKLDRRHKWEIFEGQLVYPYKYSTPCSGCTNIGECETTPTRGIGCHECGYKGRVRSIVPVPAFDKNGDFVYIEKNKK